MGIWLLQPDKFTFCHLKKKQLYRNSKPFKTLADRTGIKVEKACEQLGFLNFVENGYNHVAPNDHFKSWQDCSQHANC